MGDRWGKLRMSQDKDRVAQSEARWRMRSLNQRLGLPVTRRCDRPVHHIIGDYI